MYHMDFIGVRGRSCLCLLCVVGFLVPGLVTGNVVLIGKNFSVAFNDMEGSFAPPIKSSGECGMLYLAEPLDSCYPLTNKIIDSPKSPFALIIRGECAFDNKVRNAQKAGFKAAIIYDNEDSDSLVSMAGSSTVDIHAIFVTRASGEALKKYAGVPGIYVWIFPTFDNSAWLIMAISFVSILAMSAVLATCFFVRRHHVRREQPRASHVAECHGMSSQLVKAMPSLVFTTVVDDNCTSVTCAICLEDYILGDKLRVLPCRHKFHVFCVDSWLTSWRTFCPVCKRDARTNIDAPPASECTPLLLPATVSPSPATRIPSFHSAVSASSAIRIPPSPSPATGIPSFRSAVSASSAFRIPPSPSRLPLSSRTHSLATTPQTINQLGSFSNSPGIYISGSNRSSVDHRNMSSQQSLASYLRSSHSLGFLPPSSVTLRYASPHARSPRHGSPNYLVGSCSRHSPYLHDSFGSSSYLDQSASRQLFLHNSESVTSFSALSSAQSLPEG